MVSKKPYNYSVEKLQKLIDSSIDIISVTDADGNYLFISPAVEKLTGYSVDELTGRNCVDFVSEEDRQKTRLAQQSVINGTRLNNFYNRYIHKDGSLVPLSWSASWDNEEEVMYCIARDASELFKAQESLEQSEQRFRILVESGFDLIGIINAEHQFTYVAPSIRHTLGYSVDEFIKIPTFDLVHPDYLEMVKSDLSLISKPDSKIKLGPFLYQAADKTWRWVETVAVNKIHDPAIQGIVLNSRDVSERINFITALSKSELQYRYLFESNPLPMYAFSTENQKMIMVNDAALQQYGYSKQDFLTLSAYDIRPENTREKWDLYHKENKHKALVFAGEWVHKKSDGSLIDVEVISHKITVQNVTCRLIISLDITEKNKAKRALERSEGRFRGISENFPNGAVMILNKELIVEYIAGKELERINRKPEDFLNQYYPKFFFGEASLRVKTELSKVLQNKNVVFEVAYRNVHYLFSAVPLTDGDKVQRILLSIQNLSEQYANLNKIHVQSNILENVTSYILVTDNNYNIIYKNKESDRLFNFDESEKSAEKIFDLFPSKYSADLKEVFDQLSSNHNTDIQIEIETDHKQKSWLSLRFSIMHDEKKRETGFLCIGEDITARKRIEQEKELLIQELNSTVKDLKQFSYITSHNLRSPIANLLGIINIIEHDKINDDFTTLLIEKIREASLQLNETVTDLMNVLLIKNNVNTEKEKLSFNKIWNEVKTSVNHLIVEAGAKITSDFSEAPDTMFNKTYLESILLNLLTNAIKYRSPERKLVIHLKTKEIQNQVVLYFVDNGLGIDLSRHGNNLFGLYQRFHKHADSKGLGLYLINSQIRALGGRIEVESEVDKGSCFIVYFKAD